MKDNTKSLNDYDFRVISWAKQAWLVDLSEKNYFCSSTPCCYLHHLYPLDPDAYELHEPADTTVVSWYDVRRMAEEQGAEREDVGSVVDAEEWQELHDAREFDRRDQLVIDELSEECMANHRV
jgi:hypothetical protein